MPNVEVDVTKSGRAKVMGHDAPESIIQEEAPEGWFEIIVFAIKQVY